MGAIASKSQLRMSFLRWAVVTIPAIIFFGFLSGRSVPAGADNDWYRALAKPPLTPPDWVFPVAWTTLYILIGLALAIVLNARGSRWRGRAAALFVAQFVVNLAWTPVFFGMHQIMAAFVITVVMLVLAITTTLAFGRVRARAAWLMVPYLVWIAFAGVLTWRFAQFNPDAATLAPSSSTSQISL